MNAIRGAWAPERQAPARTCGQARLANPDLLARIIAMATDKPTTQEGKT
ncbi:hypothetical protein [Roseobacter litoralis]|nr:hypothetical protein [Roseobacter litoralis]